jgi:MoaA/NifB/PqqE/SkfB family radical SAM enzyme
LEYSPVTEGTEDWVISNEQRVNLAGLMELYRTKFPSLFISVPGDEEEFGGCLSAGKGFVHISAEGNVEPCPFVPYSDSNLRDLPLKEALQSEFLQTIRQSHEDLHETEGGCALWIKRDWVQSLLQKK